MRPRTPPKEIPDAVKIAQHKYDTRPTAWKISQKVFNSGGGQPSEHDMISRDPRGCRKGDFFDDNAPNAPEYKTRDDDDYIRHVYRASPYVPEHMYMDMSDRGLGVDGMCDMLNSMVEDTFLKHLNLTRNINGDEAAKPSKMQKLHAHLRKALRANKTLTAIDLAYNHLFDNCKHPTNEHVRA